MRAIAEEEAPRPRRPVVARGQALRRSDEDEALATSAEARQVLVEEARADWIENAPQKKALLQSRPMLPMESDL